MQIRPLVAAAFLTMATALTGCGSNEPRIVPVSGRITFKDGKPVTSGLVEFAPESGGPGARGKLGVDGSFTLMTRDRSGAVVGVHKIVVIQVFLADGAAAHVSSHYTASVVHPKYAKYETSGLTTEVKSGTENDFQIAVDPQSTSKKGW